MKCRGKSLLKDEIQNRITLCLWVENIFWIEARGGRQKWIVVIKMNIWHKKCFCPTLLCMAIEGQISFTYNTVISIHCFLLTTPQHHLYVILLLYLSCLQGHWLQGYPSYLYLHYLSRFHTAVNNNCKQY